MVVVGQIVRHSLSVFHNRDEDQLQVLELPQKIYHGSTLFLTAGGEREGNSWGFDQSEIRINTPLGILSAMKTSPLPVSDESPDVLPGSLHQRHLPESLPGQLAVSLGQLAPLLLQPLLGVLQGLELVLQLDEEPQPGE